MHPPGFIYIRKAFSWRREVIRQTKEKENARKIAEFGPEEIREREERELIYRRITMMSETLSREKSKGAFCCELSNITSPVCQL